MPHYALSQTVPFAAEDMFALISDIKRYPEFLRWINTLEVSDLTPAKPQNKRHDAKVILGFRGLTESFTTRVDSDPALGRVDIKLLRGPLKRLDAVWQVAPNLGTDADAGARGCDVKFEMAYAFSNPVLAMMAKMNMKLAVDKVMEGFLSAAHQRFTPVSVDTPTENAKEKYV